MASLLIVVTLPEPVSTRYEREIHTRFPELTIHLVRDPSKAGPYIEAADILMTFPPMLGERADALMRRAKRLKWIQALTTGVDNLVELPSLPAGVVITNMRGIHGAPVSEAALLAMLALGRNLPRALRNQDRHVWERWPVSLLNGKTVGILGIGLIAESLAPKCKALGMTVVGISSAKREVPGIDRMYGRDELVRAVRDLDFLVLLTPYSAETRGIIGAEVLSAMKPAGYLINLARGGVVNEQALLDALRERKIAGAALDVFSVEPLPPNHPFWSLPNVIITPHLGGFADVYVDLAMPVIEHNMRRFLAGDVEHMINVVNR